MKRRLGIKIYNANKSGKIRPQEGEKTDKRLLKNKMNSHRPKQRARNSFAGFSTSTSFPMRHQPRTTTFSSSEPEEIFIPNSIICSSSCIA